jgi:hypothetical protein
MNAYEEVHRLEKEANRFESNASRYLNCLCGAIGDLPDEKVREIVRLNRLDVKLSKGDLDLADRRRFMKALDGKEIDVGEVTEGTVLLALYIELVESHRKAQREFMLLRDKLVEQELRSMSRKRKAKSRAA